MPGVGKVLGSLNSGTVKSHNVTVLRPGMKATGVRKPPIGQQAPAAQWRCKICKFANPTYIEEESKEAS